MAVFELVASLVTMNKWKVHLWALGKLAFCV